MSQFVPLLRHDQSNNVSSHMTSHDVAFDKLAQKRNNAFRVSEVFATAKAVKAPFRYIC